MKITLILLILSATRGLWAGQEPRSQFLPGQTWPDNHGIHINAHGGGVLFYGGAYYWFGEHKIAGKAGNTAQVGAHCYSSTDLYNWKDENVALAVSDDPASDIAKGCVLERPKVIYNVKTGKFVMWFHLELKGQGYRAARSGVAMADQVTGPYTFLRSFRPNAGRWPVGVTEAQKNSADQKNYLARDFSGGQMARDMTLFVDDDGKAYHIYASEENQTLQISQLSDDYLSFAGSYVRAFENRSNEAPAICKHQGRYWLLTSGCTGWAPNTARSSVADSIWGPWRELGNPCVGVNSQNGVNSELTFGGQSTYILPIAGKPGAFIALFDIWQPDDAIAGGYVWLPITFERDRFTISWRDAWDLSVFDGQSSGASRLEAAPSVSWPGEKLDTWNGFTRHTFKVDGCDAWVVEPKTPLPGKPWSWCMEFPDAFVERCAAPQLLARGFYHANISVGNTFGCPDAVKHFNAFYDSALARGLATRVALIGISRGGLYAYRWAAQNPGRISVIYGDAPVCDFKSWPGGKGKGVGSKGDWDGLISCYHFKDETEALAYPGNPIDTLGPLVRAGVALIHVVGDADEVVPVTENTSIVESRYRQLGGEIQVIHKPGVGHHPHGLEDPAPVVDFIVRHAAKPSDLKPTTAPAK